MGREHETPSSDSLPGRALRLAGARCGPPAREFHPQLAIDAPEVPIGDSWLHETKWDGYRLLAELRHGKARLYTRNRLDWSARLPWLVRALEALPVREAWLDGELIALRREGGSDFSALQEALPRETQAQDEAGRPHAIRFALFDMPRLAGVDLSEVRLDERKALLAELLKDAGPELVYSTHVVGHGEEALRAAMRRGLEGIMSKRASSPYRFGRSADWRKIKRVLTDDFVVVGYTAPGGSRPGFGALLLASCEPDGLRYVGRVGTGFDDEALRSLAARLQKLQSERPAVTLPAHVPLSPRAVRWVRPELVVEVAYRDRARHGLLRQASFLRFREDKASTEIEITHPRRIVYPGDDIEKGEVVDYYRAVSCWMLPELVDRPLSLLRCPQGLSGKCFLQKHHVAALGPHVAALTLLEETGRVDYIYIRDLGGLLALVQMNALEFHPWGARSDAPEQPDRLVFDLDPAPGVPWAEVVTAARRVRERLAEVGLQSQVRTTGGKGLHVVAPILRGPSWQEVKDFCGAFAKTLAALHPDRYVATAGKARRRGLIFIDWLRNARGATSIAGWSLRARAGAPVAMPLAWDELDGISGGDAFHLQTALTRANSLRDPPWPAGQTKQRLPHLAP